jgi:TfoX/Sxy family transcriptional regulator of competence genes
MASLITDKIVAVAYNEKLTNKIRKSLAGVRELEEKKMFSGITFMVDGKMCISVGNNRIMCRIDPLLHEEATAKEGCSTVTMKGRAYKGFVYVDQEAVKLKKDLEYWIALSLDFNKRAKASKKKK